MKRNTVKFLKWSGFLILMVLLVLGLVIAYFYLRPNRSEVSEELTIETWPAVADGTHNAFTDMTYFKDSFWLVHVSSPWHLFSTKSRIVLWSSKDAHTWNKVTEFYSPGEDIRDPKLAVHEDGIVLYSHSNIDSLTGAAFKTMAATSEDGITWTPFVDMEPTGWLFWRPKSPDGGRTWYVAAYRYNHENSVLLKSTDGLTWEKVSTINIGDFNDETTIEFLADGRLLATARLEVAGYYFGDNRGNTLISVASPPYTEWTENHSTVARLDGPCLFSYNGRTYAVGRYQPGKRPYLFETGSILAKRRTSLYLVLEDRLIWLSDLPSGGDTSYPGIVIRGDEAYISYYTSNLKRDYPWIIGMFSPADVMIAKVNLKELEALAMERIEE